MNTVRERFLIFWAMLSMLAMLSGCAEVSIADSPPPITTTQPKTESALASVNRTYAALLKDIVTPDGLVRYDVLGESPRRRSLQAIVAVYAKADLPSGDDEKLAFLCNAYNVNVLKMVVGETAKEDFTSVMDIPGFFDTRSITVAGKQMTLNGLENEQIRPMGDPRIHAALVCAAMSCPPLRGEPYTADRLDEQLNDQSRRWINDPNRNGIAADVGHLVGLDLNPIRARVGSVPKSARGGEGVIDRKRSTGGSAARQVCRGQRAITTRTQYAHVAVVDRGDIDRHVVLVGNRQSALGETLVDGLLHRLDQRPGPGLIFGAGNHPQVNAIGFGVNTQIRIFLPKELGYLLVDGRLRHAQGLDITGYRHFFIHHFPQPGRHLLFPNGVHLAGRSGHAHDDLAL
ncbi:MAG: DUF547 domain-containing protein, partial [Planctomycetes bacterium]|nr:DUF547 domain-containing protein [Planctomycetota bacterium]